jgi:hypothetical protein
MAKSPTSVVAPSPVVLAGLTAVQIRDLLDTKAVTAKAVVAFLVAKEAGHGLRAPAKKLLEELTAAPAKPEAVKPAPAKPEAVKPVVAKPEAVKPVVAKADDLAATVAAAVAAAVAPLLARLAALEGGVVKPVAKAAEVKPVAKAAEPKVVAKAAEPKVVSKAAEVKPAPVVEEEAETMTEAEARKEFGGLKLAVLRDIADFDCDGMSKSEVIDEMVAQAIAEGVVIAAEPVAKAGKPNLKVVAREVAVVF